MEHWRQIAGVIFINANSTVSYTFLELVPVSKDTFHTVSVAEDYLLSYIYFRNNWTHS